MTQNFKSMLRTLLIIFCCVSLFACSKLSQSNFDKIKNGMTKQEVIALLGEPTSAESVNIMGISGTSAVWKNSTVEIDIQFLNDKVAVKLFNKLDEKPDNNNVST